MLLTPVYVSLDLILPLVPCLSLGFCWERLELLNEEDSFAVLIMGDACFTLHCLNVVL